MEINYVYCLVDPTNNERRYIGKAKNVAERYRKHLLPHYLKADTYKNRWLRKLKSQGLKPNIMILSEVDSSFDNVNDVEKFWIRIFKKAGHRLTNGTIGGDGGVTRPVTPKAPKKKRDYSWQDAVICNTLTWRVTSPDGDIKLVSNLNEFCQSNGLRSRNMYAVANGEEGRTHHKGWKCAKV